MAYTYYYSDAIQLASTNILRGVEDEKAAYLCNLALNEIWKRWDWRESIKALPPFYLLPNEQDYGSPMAVVPSDFAGLRKVWLVRLGSTPPYRQIIRVLRNLDLTHTRWLPHAISYEPAITGFRLFPRVPENVGATDYMIEGDYKCRPVKVLASTLSSTLLPIDDVYLDVWLEGLKWAAWTVSGDERAGQLVKNGPVVVATGQYGKFLAKIDEMADSEGLDLGTPPLAPAESLVLPTGAFRSALGWGL